MESNPELLQDQEASYFAAVNTELAKNPSAGQRDLASSLNMSLGATNALVRRFCGKGWLCMKKLNARTAHYLVTAEGLNVLAHRSYNYFKRTWKMMNDYQLSINKIVKSYKEKNISKVVIQSGMDAAFLFESASSENELPHVKIPLTQIKAECSRYENTLVVVEEDSAALEVSSIVKAGCFCCSVIDVMKGVE